MAVLRQRVVVLVAVLERRTSVELGHGTPQCGRSGASLSGGDPAECAALHFQSDYGRPAMIMALCEVPEPRIRPHKTSRRSRTSGSDLGRHLEGTSKIIYAGKQKRDLIVIDRFRTRSVGYECCGSGCDCA
jgi:hypothetical protein